jgi:hypothetical protein
MITTLSYGSALNKETKDAKLLQLFIGSRSSFFWISKALSNLYMEGGVYLGFKVGGWTNTVERTGTLVYYGPNGTIPDSSIHNDFGTKLGLGYRIPVAPGMAVDIAFNWMNSLLMVYDGSNPNDFELRTSMIMGRLGLIYRLR